jgi:hypothetical protein
MPTRISDKLALPPAGKKRIRRWLVIFAVIALTYGVVAYALLPLLWRHYEHQQGLASKPMITETAEGIPGDPLNVGLVGDEAELHRIMLAAGWQPADAITLRTSIAIAGSVVLDRPYEGAPVSTLFYEGRRQDFAFEKAIGGSADRRHHVRLWLVLAKGNEGRSVWLGAATRDLGVGLSHYTGQITHHIAADIDAERDALLADLTASRTRRSTRFPAWGLRCLAATAKAIIILPTANCALRSSHPAERRCPPIPWNWKARRFPNSRTICGRRRGIWGQPASDTSLLPPSIHVRSSRCVGT